ncbi:MAG: ABC transporter ATP-binding protein, partial [Candidatus Micrarchaeia archaeon]
MIETFELTKKFGGLTAVDEVTLSVKEGEILVVVGPNGAGKSTLVKMLCTILSPTSGSARIMGFDIVNESQKVRSLVGYLPEEPRVYDYMTGEEFLSFFADIYNSGRENIPELLEFVGLKEHAKRKIGEYSKGMKHRISLARALIHNPPVLVLDEPTMGLDPASSRDVRERIKEMRKEGKTILVCTHYMDEADFLSDKLAVINNGRIAAVGKPEELKAKVAKQRYLGVVIKEDSLVRKFAEEVGGEIDGRNIIIKTKNLSRTMRKVNSVARKLNAKVLSVKTLDPSLEDVFVAVTR